MTITTGQALPGDVILDGDGTCWQRGDEFYNWATFSGPVLHFGPWEASYGPQGELTLLVREGKPVR
jgi:hypothetical protein